MSDQKLNIIGTGWGFPPSFNRSSRKATMVTGLEDIRQSLNILFSTRPGERILAQQYGCDIPRRLFNNITLSEETQLKNMIQRAITNYEARIKVNAIDLDTSRMMDGIIYIQIDFVIQSTNSRHNIVYPFFVEEGTFLPREL
ncbi:MAG: GPW/gp25 family protein [Bacteroidota bacterium]